MKKIIEIDVEFSFHMNLFFLSNMVETADRASALCSETFSGERY